MTEVDPLSFPCEENHQGSYDKKNKLKSVIKLNICHDNHKFNSKYGIIKTG